VYLGHLPTQPDLSESEDGVSAVEFAHHDLLNQVLDDSRSKLKSLSSELKLAIYDIIS
jgi:hypothetical protein